MILKFQIQLAHLFRILHMGLPQVPQLSQNILLFLFLSLPQIQQFNVHPMLTRSKIGHSKPKALIYHV